MHDSKISVIMPTYNTPEQYFKPAIESILNQSYSNLELIIVDDGSTLNDIHGVVQSYKDKRLKYLNNGHNGAGPARNMGIEYATGDYIYIMASDDVLNQDTFKICVELIDKYKPDIVLFNLYGENDTGKVHSFVHPVRFDITNPGDTTQICKKSLITNNDIKYENLSSCNDLTFTYSILACAKSVVKIERGLYYYNECVPNQISSYRGKVAKNVFLAFDALKNNLEKYDLFDVYKKMFYNIFAQCVKYQLSKITDESYRQEFVNILHDKYPQIEHAIYDYRHKIIGKQSFDNGKRIIYFCGIKLFTYYKRKKA